LKKLSFFFSHFLLFFGFFLLQNVKELLNYLPSSYLIDFQLLSKYSHRFFCFYGVICREDSMLNTPPFPCGACRQVLAEYEYRQKEKIRFIFHAQTGKTIVIDGVENILPFPFVGE